MTGRWAKRGWLAALCLGLLAPATQAQEEIVAPITAKASPQVSLAGLPVVLSGETPKVPAGNQVTVTVRVDTTPDQAGGDEAEPRTHTVGLDEKGRWTLKLSDDDTATLGRYAVQVTAPDGKGEASTQFDVVDDDAFDELLNESAQAMEKSLDATAATAITTLNELAQGLPDVPERNAVIVRVNKLVQVLVQLRQVKLSPLPPLPPEEPGVGQDTVPLRLHYTQVAEQFRQVTEQSDSVRAQLAKTRLMADTCQRLDSLVEAFNMTSSIFNFAGGPLTVAKNLLADKVIPAMIERHVGSSTPEAKEKAYRASALMKVAVSHIDGMMGIAAGVPGLALDGFNKETKQVYDLFCTRFEGMFTATFFAQFFTDESAKDPYYQYRITLAGVASLTQPKAQDGRAEPVASLMRGRFDGQAVEYEVLQDALKLQPGMRSQLMFEEFIAPQGKITLMPPEFGVGFNAAVHPLAFQIPIKAERQRDILTLNFGEAAIRDMSPKINRGLLVHVFNAGIMPVLNYQEFPMQDAYFILSRGMRKDAKFERVGGVERFANKFHREETPPGLRLVWDVDVEMCNPGCATTATSLDRLKAWYDSYAAKRDAGKKKK